MTYTHERRLSRRWYDDIANGTKRWELRRNDRPDGYRIGDLMRLAEHDTSMNRVPTGRTLVVRITSVVTDVDGLESGYVLLGIVLVEEP